MMKDKIKATCENDDHNPPYVIYRKVEVYISLPKLFHVLDVKVDVKDNKNLLGF